MEHLKKICTKKTFIISVIIVLLIISCNKEEEIVPSLSCCPGPQLDFSISLIDKNGIDLLNPKNSNSFIHSEIRLYEDSTESNDVTYDWSSNNTDSLIITQYFDSINNPYILHLKAHSEFYENSNKIESTVLLKLAENDFDTIQATIEVSSHKKLVKIKYNNIMLFDIENNIPKSEFYSVITK